MKKLIALLLAVLMVFALVACASNEAKTEEPDTTPADTTPADTTPSDTTPADTTPADETPAATGNEKLVLGFAQIGQESGWRDAETNDIQWYAARNLDTVELVFADAQQKQENQVKAIRNLILQEVDYIVLDPIVETGWESVLEEAKEANEAKQSFLSKMSYDIRRPVNVKDILNTLKESKYTITSKPLKGAE